MFLFNFAKFVITKNNVKYDTSKKNIILVIKKSPGEIDWILPLLFNLKGKYNIFTIFQKNITLNLLKKNYELYELWKNTSFAYTIQPALNAIFYRLFLKIFFFAKNNKIYNNISNKVNYKIYNFSNLQDNIIKKYNTKKSFTAPKAIFLEFTNKSFWLNSIKKFNPDLKCVYFPHTSNIFSNINKKFKFKSLKTFNELLLLSNNRDVSYWKNFYPNSKIVVSGYLRYEKYWINKILKINSFKNKKIQNRKVQNRKIFFIAIDGYHHKLNKKKYLEQIENLMDICLKLKNIFVIFKLHPFTPSKFFYQIMQKYPKKNWTISENHLISLVNSSDVFISFYNSPSSMEALALGKFPIELWNTNYEKRVSIFRKLNLVKHTDNMKTLEIAIKNQLNNKKNKLKISKPPNKFKKICKIEKVNYRTKKIVLEFLNKKNN